MKVKLVTIIVMILMICSLGIVATASAAMGDYTYQIQVYKDGKPYEGAIVRLAGVGVEITGAEGIAVLDISDARGKGQGRVSKYRGPNYAAKKGKSSGSVTDEYSQMNITISSHDIDETPAANKSSFAMGTTIFIKLNTVYRIDI